MEGDAIEVRDDLINVCGSSSVSCQSDGVLSGQRRGSAHPENRSLSKDSIRTFW